MRGGECREGEEEEEGAIIDSLNRRLADGRLAWCQVNETLGGFVYLIYTQLLSLYVYV